MPTKNKSTRKARKPKPAAPPWMKASWKTAGRKPLDKFTARDIDAVISEVRAENNPKAYKPVKLSITLTKSKAAWLKKTAAEWHCSIEELIMNAVWVYQYGQHSHLEEDREYFTKPVREQPPVITKAISEGTGKFKTGRYEP
jgi:hypothetical protein